MKKTLKISILLFALAVAQTTRPPASTSAPSPTFPPLPPPQSPSSHPAVNRQGQTYFANTLSGRQPVAGHHFPNLQQDGGLVEPIALSFEDPSSDGVPTPSPRMSNLAKSLPKPLSKVPPMYTAAAKKIPGIGQTPLAGIFEESYSESYYNDGYGSYPSPYDYNDYSQHFGENNGYPQQSYYGNEYYGNEPDYNEYASYQESYGQGGYSAPFAANGALFSNSPVSIMSGNNQGGCPPCDCNRPYYPANDYYGNQNYGNQNYNYEPYGQEYANANYNDRPAAPPTPKQRTRRSEGAAEGPQLPAIPAIPAFPGASNIPMGNPLALGEGYIGDKSGFKGVIPSVFNPSAIGKRQYYYPSPYYYGNPGYIPATVDKVANLVDHLLF